MSNLIFLDLEWNTAFIRDNRGRRVPFHELLEIAAIKVDEASGAMMDSFHSYVNPKASRRIGFYTYQVLPYSPEELEDLLSDAPGFLDLGPDFLHWCGPNPVFVEWGSNDVDVLLNNYKYHKLSFDADWKYEYFDLQYIYQSLCGGDLGCQPSLEKAVTALELDTDLDFHSAWNDTYYTVLVYQTLLDRCESFSMFRRPPKPKNPPPIWEEELGVFNGRWACKNLSFIEQPHCPICGAPVEITRWGWVRTTPNEQTASCFCAEHRRLYLTLTVQPKGRQWSAHAAFYKNAGQIAERYHKTCQQISTRNKQRAAAAKTTA